jgi:hypothetical protein
MKTAKKFLITFALSGMVLGMMLAMAASALGKEKPDIIQLDREGVYALQRIMSENGYRCKVISGYIEVYMADNYTLTSVEVRIAGTQERRHYILMYQFSPTELFFIKRYDDEDPTEKPHINPKYKGLAGKWFPQYKWYGWEP